MALKDWKKTKGYKNSWKNIKANKLISYSDWHQYKDNKGHFVQVSDTSWPFTVRIDKSFKTKSAALKYAKDYMKKH